MAKKKSLTEEEIRTRRMQEAADKRKAALQSMAEAKQLEEELGLESPEAPEIIPAQPAPQDPTLGLEAILSEIEGEDNSRWEAYNLNNGPEVRLGVFPLAQWPDHLETLARQIGGGVIKVKFRRGNGSNATQRTFTFDKQAYKKEVEAAVIPKEGGESALMAQVLAGLREELREERRNGQALQMKLIEAANKSPFSDLKGLKDMVEVMVPKPKSAMDSVKEVFELLAILKDDGIQPPSPLEKAAGMAVDLLRPLVEAGASKLFKAIPPSSKGTDTPERAALPEPGAVSPPTRPENGGPTGEPASMTPEQACKVYGEQILRIIGLDFTPDTAIGSVMDRIQPDEAKVILPLLTRPNIVEELTAAAPGLGDHRTWVVEFVAGLKDELADFMVPQTAEEEPAHA